jgi:hypothetical protein
MSNSDTNTLDKALEAETDDRGDEFVDENDDKTSDGALEADEQTSEEEEGKADETTGEEEGTEPDTAGKFIPKSRFDEAVLKERQSRQEAEAALAEAREQLAANQPDPIAERLRAIEEAVEQLDATLVEAQIAGDRDKLMETNRKIRALEREALRVEAVKTTSVETSRQLAQRELELAVAQLEAQHPEFNPASEQYDQEAVDYAIFKQQQLIGAGKSPGAAMLEGAQAAISLRGKKADPTPSKGLASAAAVADRKAKQVEKNIDTARRQPPSLTDVGKDSDLGKVDASRLSDEEFDKLPESTKARLRGDTL